MTIRHSSVNNYRRRLSNSEAAALILKRAADHIYNQQENGEPRNYRAVDLMDAIRHDLDNEPPCQCGGK